MELKGGNRYGESIPRPMIYLGFAPVPINRSYFSIHFKTITMSQKEIDSAYRKSLKPSYKHLTKKEYRLMKKIQKYDAAEKALYAPLTGFYSTCPRLPNNAVDVGSLTERQLDFWEAQNRILNILSAYDDAEITRVRDKFNQTQFKFSQSF